MKPLSETLDCSEPARQQVNDDGFTDINTLTK